MATCYMKLNRHDHTLFNFQTMLTYSWLNKDFAAEIRAYNNLAITYFNLADLKNSKYYHERGLNCILEPEDSRTKIIAC
jgi:hypothetical protein